MCEQCEEERAKLAAMMLKHPRPCVVCKDENVVGAGTWVPDHTKALAVGTQEEGGVFVFCVCNEHIEPTEENEKLIIQSIIRMVRSGSSREV